LNESNNLSNISNECTSLFSILNKINTKFDNPIKLKSVNYDIREEQRLRYNEILEKKISKDDQLYIIQFKDKDHYEEYKKELEKEDVNFLDYLPDYSFIAKMDDSTAGIIAGYDFINWIGSYEPEYKIELSLKDKEGKIKLIIIFIDSFNQEDFKSFINESGGEVIYISNKMALVNINVEETINLANYNSVGWIEEFKERKISNDVARNITKTDIIFNDYGYYGEGQIIAVADTGLDTGVNDSTIHDDFEGRVIHIENLSSIYPDISNDSAADVDSGHGTHVAGSVLGNGNKSGSSPGLNNYTGSYAGMAPKAKLYFQATEILCDDIITCGLSLLTYVLVGIPVDLNDLFQPAYNAGARIHTNSWGSAVDGDYDASSSEADTFVWNNTDMVILFSAGNNGVDGDSDGVIDEDSMGSPGTAKNVITIGASESVRSSGGYSEEVYGTGSWEPDYPVNPIHDDLISNNSNGLAAFSSRGPTDDGRIKPDLVAPGTDILSTKSTQTAQTGWGAHANTYYTYMGGTSMATPLSAGIVAIVREYYTKNQSLDYISAALVKATLINGAYDMTPGQYGSGATKEISRRPDNNQGWGRIDLNNSIFPVSPKVIDYYDNQTITTSTNRTYNFTVTNSSVEARVTLVWTDYPSTEIAATNLVNDIDLIITSPNGTKYKGNDFTAPYDNSRDSVNNVESVDFINPINGTYTVTISGYNIPQVPQTFALVISYGNADTTAPVVHLIAPRNNSYSNVINVIHSFNVTDESGPANCTMFWSDFSPSNSANWEGVPVDGSEIDAGVLNSSDGDVHWTVNCTDPFGNTGTAGIWNYTVDTTYPTIDFEGNTTTAGHYSQNWTYLNVTVTEINLNRTTIYLYNSSGLVESVEKLVANSIAQNFTNLPDGRYYINATVSDLAGNRNNTATRNITLDTIFPRINITYPQNTTYPSIITSMNHTLIETNQQTCWFYNGTANNTITCGQNITTNLSSSQGSNTWIVYANDSAGNINSTSVTFVVDTIAPSINFTSPTETSGLTNSTRNYVLVNVTSEDTNLRNITIRLYNSSRTIINSTNSTTSPLYANFSNLADGIYYLNATACDNIGNCNNTETINVTIDANPPIITINSPALNSYYKSAISFNVTLNKNGTCLYSIDGAINKSMSPSADNRNFNATNSSMSQAAHNVTFSCNDTYNTWNFTSRAFYFDTTAPVVTLISPEDGSTDYEEDEDINFKYNVTDAFGIANCSLLIDEEVISTDTTITNNDDEQTISYEGISSSETYEWTIKCYDYAGNPHEPSVWTIEIQAASDDGSDDSSSSSSGSDDPVIYKVSDTKLSQGYTKQMGVGDKLNFSVDSTSHILTLKSIKGKNATITIASTPQTITLKEGEEIKLDLASDNYYDIIVKLMNISGSTAKINIKSIYELKPPTLRSTTNSSSNLTTNSSLGNTEGNDGWINESWMNKLVNSFKEFFLDTFSNKYVLIGAGVLVVGGIVCLVLYVRKKIRQKKGWDK
jgi:hypothetical protein